MAPIATATASRPDGAASPSASPAVRTAQPCATRIDSRPAGIGFPGLATRSRSTSATSFTAPIDNCMHSMDRPSRDAVTGLAPATTAMPAVATAFKRDGKAWLRRISPTARRSAPGQEAGSDVDQLVEVRDQVVDQPAAAVGHEPADARYQRPQADRRHDQMTAAVAPERARRAATESEHPFEFSLA